MSSSLPDGLSLRQGQLDDVGPATETLRAEEVVSRGSSDWGETDTQNWFRLLDLKGELWIVEDGGGRIAGVLGLLQREDLFDGWIVVHPDFSGGGLGSSLVREAEARVRERGGSRLHLGSLAENVGGVRLLQNAGYRPVRHYFRMEIELDSAPPEPKWPEGITCATFAPADARAVYDALNDAFAEEWNFRPLPFEEWKHHRLEAPDFDPELWFVARAGNEIVGVACCDSNRWGGGWVGALAVRTPWRRHGLGLALLRQAFGQFHRRGATKVGLGVDAENPTGATRLYERAGMRLRDEDIRFERELA